MYLFKITFIPRGVALEELQEDSLTDEIFQIDPSLIVQPQSWEQLQNMQTVSQAFGGLKSSINR